MEWTKEDKRHLLDFRKNLDSDDIKLKQEIKERLLNNKYILHVLNNTHLEKTNASPSEYYNVNIRPYYMIPEIQSEVNNFLCFETQWSRLPNNPTNKLQQIVFYILCEEKTCFDKETSLPRHDLLAALVEEEFNYTTLSCGRLMIVNSKPNVTDTHFSTRVLTFECITDRNLVKTINGVPTLINKGAF